VAAHGIGSPCFFHIVLTKFARLRRLHFDTADRKPDHLQYCNSNANPKKEKNENRSEKRINAKTKKN